MSITVRELLQLPHLRLTLTAGAAGLDRQVSWVHSSDLPNPWQWLEPAELLLTNLEGLTPGDVAQVRFLERLAETGASGLGVGVGMGGPPVSVQTARRADELAFPLISVPYSVPFTAVARAVADANGREEARLLGRVARLYELLRTSVIAGRPGSEMFRRLGEELGVRLYLVDPETGLSLFGDAETTSFAAALVASYAAHGNAIPGVLRLTRSQAAPGEPAALAAALAVEVPGAQPTVLVAEPVGAELPSLVLLHHIATGGALELAQLGAVQERQRRLGADLLSQLLDRGIDPRLAQSLITEAGLDLAASVLAVARAETDQDCAGLHRKLARSHLPHLLLDRDHLLYVVLPEAALDGHLASALAESARIGSSARLVTPARLPEAVQEARWALGAAEAENRTLVRYGDQTTLLLPRSVTEAQALVSRILGPLVTNDAEHGTTYVDTLRVILRHNRSWQLAAAELHIHKQTLGYRIRKIEQLTGRGLTRTEHLAEWWFALRAHDLLTGRGPG
ncbi:MAG TPA: PucR family transcriptional regulator ligand-binding domain-containing protein [Streptosporangiaceae bacterium]|nr:PucR family transcriptional regulator ligand-binding domain-containing protein [Streptosporangiaceae bacterium]